MPSTNYIYTWESKAMRDVGQGDADVYTQSGRATTVKVDITAPVVEQWANRLKAHVIYDVIDGRKDHTHLQLDQEIILPLPGDWIDVKLKEAVAYKYEAVIYGRNHRWNDVPIGPLHWIQRLQMKVDGPGDDLDGNVGLRIAFAIPLEYKRR